jgi:nitrogenase-associated protein
MVRRMTHLIFYEKPGCAGNARQRALLQAAGHTLERRDLLSHPWTRAELLAFLGPLPVLQWFNRAAPRLKHGQIDPERLDRDAALQLLQAEPLLIRRPLLQRAGDGARMVGFEADALRRFVGLDAQAAAGATLEGCAAPREHCAPASPQDTR